MSNEQLLQIAHRTTEPIEALILASRIAESPQARMAGCLTLSILELHKAVLLVLDSYSQSHAPILVRTIQESFVTLTLLNKNPEYLNQIHYDDALQSSKTIKAFLAILPDESDEWLPRLDEQKAIAKTHFDAGLRPQQINTKFQNAGLAEQYGAYTFMCSFSHNNSTNMYARHGAIGELKFGEELPIDTFSMIVKMSLSMLYDALLLMPQFSSITQAEIEQIAPVIKELMSDLDC